MVQIKIITDHNSCTQEIVTSPRKWMIRTTLVRKDVTDNPITTDMSTVKYSKIMRLLCATSGAIPSTLAGSNDGLWPILLKNSVLRAAQKFAKNLVLSCAHPFTLISATELRQEVFS